MTILKPQEEKSSATINLGNFFIGSLATLFAIFQLPFAQIHAGHDSTPEVINESTGVIYTDLQTAINDASIANIDTLKIKGIFVGHFTIDKNIVLKGCDDAVLDGDNSGRVLTITGTNIDKSVTVEHLTIQNGKVTGTDNGGGVSFIVSTGTNPTFFIKHSDIIKNESTNFGGGLYFQGLNVTDGTLTVIDSKFLNNNANAGGGIYVSEGDFNLQSSLVKLNTSLYDGGGIWGGSTAVDSINITDSKLKNNYAGGNGGGAAFSENNVINFTHVEVEENIAFGNGGGLFFDENGSINLNKVEVEKNSATDGGGIYLNNEDQHIGFNEVDGGIYAVNANGGPLQPLINTYLVILDSELEKNIALRNGGGLYNNNPTGITTLDDSKVTKNVAADGGGIYNTNGSNLILIETKAKHNTPNEITDL